MIHRSTSKEVEAYFNTNALNQSSLKRIIEGRLAFMEMKTKTGRELYYEEKGHFIIGSGVDLLLSNYDEFDNMYFYKELKKPSDNLVSLGKSIYDACNQNGTPLNVQFIDTDAFKYIVHDSLKLIDYYNTTAKADWKADGRMGRIEKTDFYTYMKGLVESNGKQVIDTSEKETIYAVHASLTKSPVTSELFEDKQGCDIYFQKTFYFMYRGFACKAMIDRLEINHHNKTIQIDDWKTMSGETIDFLKSLKARRYDIQVAWYWLAVMTQIVNSFKTERYREYEVLLPRFIVESTDVQGLPRIFTCDAEIMIIGKYGKKEFTAPFLNTEEDTVYSKYVPELWGYDRCITEIEWYNDNGWQTDRNYIESGGHHIINWSKTINI